MSIRGLFIVGLAFMLASCSDELPEMTPVSTGHGPANAPGGLPGFIVSPKSEGPRKHPLLAESGRTKAPKERFAELMAEAERLFKIGNLATGCELVEEALKIEPKNRYALLVLSAIDQDRAKTLETPEKCRVLHRAAELMRTLRAEYKDLKPNETIIAQEALGNDARAYLLEGNTDKALASLAEAADAGFPHHEALRQDPDFDALRKLPRFQEILTEVEKSARVQAKTQAAALLSETRGFPFHFNLPDLEGKPVALDDFKGKVVIADFWGTWCPPCRHEIPHLAELYKKYQDKGLVVVGLTYENGSEATKKEALKSYLKLEKVPYPCVLGDDKTMGLVAGFSGFPTTLFIDRSGRVRAVVKGFNPDSLPTIEALTTTLLAEDTAGQTSGS